MILGVICKKNRIHCHGLKIRSMCKFRHFRRLSGIFCWLSFNPSSFILLYAHPTQPTSFQAWSRSTCFCNVNTKIFLRLLQMLFLSSRFNAVINISSNICQRFYWYWKCEAFFPCFNLQRCMKNVLMIVKLSSEAVTLRCFTEKKGVLKHFLKFTGKYLCLSLLFIKLQSVGLQLY